MCCTHACTFKRRPLWTCRYASRRTFPLNGCAFGLSVLNSGHRFCPAGASGVYWNRWPLGRWWGARGPPWSSGELGRSEGRSSRKPAAQLGRWWQPSVWQGQAGLDAVTRVCHRDSKRRLFLCHYLKMLGVRACERAHACLSGRRAPSCGCAGAGCSRDLWTGQEARGWREARGCTVAATWPSECPTPEGGSGAG